MEPTSCGKTKSTQARINACASNQWRLKRMSKEKIYRGKRKSRENVSSSLLCKPFMELLNLAPLSKTKRVLVRIGSRRCWVKLSRTQVEIYNSLRQCRKSLGGRTRDRMRKAL